MKDIFDYLKRNKMLFLLVTVVVLGVTGYFFTHQTRKPVANEIRTETKSIKKTTSEKIPKVSVVAVDIQGAVNKPGVYRIKSDAIVQEVIQMAGGLLASADVKQVNQAKKVADQMQIYVPNQGEKSLANNSSGSKESKVVNINTATVDDFKNVTGIGPKKAEKIIAFREKNGNFKELHDLTKVSGIGEKSLDSLKDQLTV